MIIKRVINGKIVTIKLSDSEIELAYIIQQHKYDMVNILNLIDEYENEEEIIDYLGAPTLFINEHIEDIAYETRRLLDKYPYNYPENAAIDAIKTLYNERPKL